MNRTGLRAGSAPMAHSRQAHGGWPRRSVLGALLAAWAVPGLGQPRPLRIVAPFPPGGSTDILARFLAEKFGAALGQTVIVENRPGANGALGIDAVARAAPDGQTLLVTTNSGITINPLLYKTFANPIEALAPVAQLVELELVLAVRADLPARTLRDFVALAKSRPQGLTFASVGSGSLSHLTGEAFRIAAGVPMLHVPYKGAAPALTDLLGGQVDCYFGTPPTFLPHVKTGKLRVLANTAATPSPYFEALPRVADLFAGFDIAGWQGLFVPAATPRLIIDALERNTLAALSDEGVRARLREQGMLVTARPGHELAALARLEQASWAKVIETAKITVR